MKSALIAAGLSLIAGVTQSQGAPDDYDPSVLAGCLNADWFRGEDVSSCIGVAAAACMAGEAGSSTVGMSYCLGREAEQWDDLLNSTYQVLRDQQADKLEDNRAVYPEFPDGTEALKEMQRAWIEFRDAACEFEYIQWSGGTGAGPAGAECHMRLTALQTIRLRAWLD